MGPTEKLLSEFGNNLQELRKAKGLSTREFADVANISHSSVARLEAGLTNPTMTTLIKLADALDIDMDTLTMRK